MQQPQVRRAELAEAAEVAAVYGRAILDEAVTAWILEDSPEVAEYFRTERAPERITKALQEDEVWIAGAGDDIWAVSVWQTVTSLDRFEAEAAELRTFSGQVPSRPFERITALTTATAAAHPREFPHHYLQVIVTLPEFRGRGAGAAIITDRMKSVDAPAYLEASTERSARLYERCGFTRIGADVDLPDGGPTLRPMWFQG
ncbi:GNAT family N-acetyltransferase [Nocardia sp. NBC_01503]|uniref:GNAT family N-acetyltransferase n=1 Tax=Nocardia sp. NBC_01503 TaxID=2975997 RepID=UPI002E7BF33C|nr:GNAT family N-acetyltransferase [Nocardia sp. NBC_01503]WTL32710.1 GNAT family N-acetyltransferase [Nocardia sp. NBC_01503]